MNTFSIDTTSKLIDCRNCIVSHTLNKTGEKILYTISNFVMKSTISIAMCSNWMSKFIFPFESIIYCSVQYFQVYNFTIYLSNIQWGAKLWNEFIFSRLGDFGEKSRNGWFFISTLWFVGLYITLVTLSIWA